MYPHGRCNRILPLTSYAATDISDFNFDEMKAQNACRNARTQKLEGDVNGAIVTGEDGKQYIVDGDYRYLYENGTDGSTPGVTSTTAGLTPEKPKLPLVELMRLIRLLPMVRRLFVLTLIPFFRLMLPL